jgi:hypothetical protein
LHFDYASARAPTSSKRPAPTATRGSSYTAPLPLRFLYSFLDELFPEMTLNTNSRVRKKCLVVYLRKKGYQRKEVAEIVRIDEDTVTNYTKKYDESGLPGLLEENYHQPKSQLEPYTE